MKRITYISRISQPLSMEEIETIGVLSGQNNIQANITGLLVYFEKLFFQIIEGDDDEVDQLFMKIGQDPRHNDILKLKTEYGITERLFPTWFMKTINLDGNVDELMRPIKILLQTVAESHSIVERYTQPTILKILNEGITARLEGLTREVKRSLVLSEALRRSTKEPWTFVSLGKYNLKGMQNISEVYSIDHELVNEFKQNMFVL